MTAAENQFLQDVENGIKYCHGGSDGNIQKQLSSEVSSGDELITKVRKPYTITKQRERWTGEEHQKFLEALKLYGRAWRRIEEHIGTKTAVQIRSHAQKFFAKLEREQAAGTSTGNIPSIDIPPPRPKRKPNHPYPRKAAELKSQPMLASAASLARPPVPDPKMKPAFFPYMPGRNSNHQPELKLFGHTVIIPTAARAVRTGVHKPTETDQVCSELLGDSVAAGEQRKGATKVPAAPAMKKTMSNCVSELSMLDSSENDSSNGQCGEATEQEESCKAVLPPFEQPPALDFAGRCYAKFLDGLTQGTAVPPFFPWQQAGFAAAAAAWPGSTVNEVLRSMFTGMPPEACKPENSTALAAATIAAASAWWTLQASVPTSFLGQPVGEKNGLSLPLRQDNALQEDKQPQDAGRSDAILRPATCKRPPRDEDLERRVRSRSVSASNEPCETEDNQLPSRPPSSSSASDCVAGSNILESLVDAGSRWSPDKDKEEGTDIIRQHSSNSSGLQRSKQHHGRKATRCQDGEQWREVSLGGRMAFQALFSHERLPQTFRKRKQDDRRDSAEIGSSNVESDSQCVCARDINNTIKTSNSNRDNNASNKEQEEQASGSRKECQECRGRKPVRNESVGSNSSLLSPTRSSRSGFVPYRRAVSTNDNKTPTRSSCGLENHLVGSAWCSVDEEVVKHG